MHICIHHWAKMRRVGSTVHEKMTSTQSIHICSARRERVKIDRMAMHFTYLHPVLHKTLPHVYMSLGHVELTHWGLNKTTGILQTVCWQKVLLLLKGNFAENHDTQFHVDAHLKLTIWLKFVTNHSTDIKSSLVEVMAWHWTGKKPLPESIRTTWTPAFWDTPIAPWLPILVIHIRSQVKTRQSRSYKF